MRCVIQRVKSAAVSVTGEIVGEIGLGLLIYLGVAADDEEKDRQFLGDKIPHLRIFPDAEGKMNRSLLQVNGSLLVVSQFTLQGDCRQGRRPGFSRAAAAAVANNHYETLIEQWRKEGIPVESGIFQSDMLVESVNWGPVTFILDTKE